MATGEYADSRRKSCQSTGYLKHNYFRERGYGIIVSDQDGKEIFAHIKNFWNFKKAIDNEGVYRLEYRRRLRYRLAFDVVNDRRIARDITLIGRELMAPDGTIHVLPTHWETFKAAKEAEEESVEAERKVEARRGFGELVAQLR
jgi:cold shock CspA family protein